MPSSSGDRHRSHRSEKERSGSRESSRRHSSRDDRSSSHSSSSSRRDKHRRRSRSPKDEKGKASHSSASGKSTVKMIEEAKNRMRAGLAAADVGPIASSTLSDVKAASSGSALDIASRHREIELIDLDRGFEPESFVSSVGGKRPLRDSDHAATLEKQDEHENAIFGQVSANKGELNKELALKDGGGVGAHPKRQACPLAHENLSIDPKAREDKWLKNWRAMRAKMLIN